MLKGGVHPCSCPLLSPNIRARLESPPPRRGPKVGVNAESLFSACCSLRFSSAMQIAMGEVHAALTHTATRPPLSLGGFSPVSRKPQPCPGCHLWLVDGTGGLELPLHIPKLISPGGVRGSQKANAQSQPSLRAVITQAATLGRAPRSSLAVSSTQRGNSKPRWRSKMFRSLGLLVTDLFFQ